MSVGRCRAERNCNVYYRPRKDGAQHNPWLDLVPALPGRSGDQWAPQNKAARLEQPIQSEKAQTTSACQIFLPTDTSFCMGCKGSKLVYPTPLLSSAFAILAKLQESMQHEKCLDSR